jgi:glutamine synthetase
LLRSSAATAGNDHRLGANEAPPAIISIFFGDQVCAILDNVADGKAHSNKEKSRVELGVTSMPSLPMDISDRNRTSPFAFTGNKFEFRMVGSSQSIATPNTYLNTAVAQVLSEFAAKLEGATDKTAAIEAIIKESYPKHRKVVFNGNGYSEEWVKEAERRGLPNIRSTVEALQILKEPESIELFETHHVMSKAEMESRYHIYLEKYSKQINIEAGVMIDMSKRSIFPAVSTHAAALARDSVSLASIGANSAAIEKRATRLAELGAGIYDETDKLERVLTEAQEVEDALLQARAYREKVVTRMVALRTQVDLAEKLVEKKAWPMPTYEELLFTL